jgi:hypothetical protein
LFTNVGGGDSGNNFITKLNFGSGVVSSGYIGTGYTFQLNTNQAIATNATTTGITMWTNQGISGFYGILKIFLVSNSTFTYFLHWRGNYIMGGNNEFFNSYSYITSPTNTQITAVNITFSTTGFTSGTMSCNYY